MSKAGGRLDDLRDDRWWRAIYRKGPCVPSARERGPRAVEPYESIVTAAQDADAAAKSYVERAYVNNIQGESSATK